MPANEPRAPEQRTIDVDVEDLDTRGRTLHGYAAVYGAVSGDLGGFKERIAPGAFRDVLDADVRALLNHDPNEVLGRTKSGTMRLFDEQRGLRFEIDVPDSPLGENVKAAVKRGDIDGASFRFQVGEESWDGDLRTVNSVKSLHDVTLATYPAYPDSSVELRSRTDATRNENEVSEEKKEESVEAPEKVAVEDRTEEKVEERKAPAGSLRVEDRAEHPGGRGLMEEFRSGGFPTETAEVSWDEYRTATFGGTIDVLNQLNRQGSPLGYDQRWAYPAFTSIGVDSATTSIQVYQQGTRTIPAGTAIVRAVDAVTTKPEVATGGTVTTVPLNQVAAVETNIPNILLEQDNISSIVEVDLRLAIDTGLDQLFKTVVDASGFQAPGSDVLPVSVRKAMGTIQDSGYNPDTLIVTPGAAIALDTLVTGLTGGSADFVFGAGRFAPGQIFGLNVRVSKVVAAPVVVDSRAFGKLYVSPISLARFEVDSGTTNRSNVRLEGQAAFGVERQAAAVRIASS